MRLIDMLSVRYGTDNKTEIINKYNTWNSLCFDNLVKEGIISLENYKGIKFYNFNMDTTFKELSINKRDFALTLLGCMAALGQIYLCKEFIREIANICNVEYENFLEFSLRHEQGRFLDILDGIEYKQMDMNFLNKIGNKDSYDMAESEMIADAWAVKNMNLDFDTYILYRDKVITKAYRYIGILTGQAQYYMFDRKKCFELSKVIELPYKGR